MDELNLWVLHEHPELIEATADLLNEEWSRSKTSRIHSLSKSCDELPCNLILISENKDDDIQIIGHSRLASVYENSKARFLESVVVRKSLRGKGYGRKIMDETEKYAKSTGVDTIYLTTTDKEAFYRHLGYELCTPIISYGSAKIPEHLLQKLTSVNISAKTQSATKTSSKVTTSSSYKLPSNVPAPPVPPPLPPKTSDLKNEMKNKFNPHKVVWMKKELQSNMTCDSNNKSLK